MKKKIKKIILLIIMVLIAIIHTNKVKAVEAYEYHGYKCTSYSLEEFLDFQNGKKTDLNIVLSSDEPFYLGAGQDGDRKANSNPAQYYKKWNFTMPVMRTSKKNANTAGKIIKKSNGEQWAESQYSSGDAGTTSYKAIIINVPIFCIDPTRSTPGIDAAGYTLAQVNNTGNFHDDNWYKANSGHNVKMTPALANMWKYILYKDIKQGEKVKWDDFTREKQVAIWMSIYDNSLQLTNEDKSEIAKGKPTDAEKAKISEISTYGTTENFQNFVVARAGIHKGDWTRLQTVTKAVDLYKEAQLAAQKITNMGTNNTPTEITSNNAKIEKIDGKDDTYKLGPFTLKYNTERTISGITVEGDKGTVTQDTNPYIYADGSQGKNIPTSGSQFYIVVKDIEKNGFGSITKITVKSTYKSYSDIKLYKLYGDYSYTNNGTLITGVYQPLLTAEGTVKTKEDSSSATLNIATYKSSKYTMSLSKIDSEFKSPVAGAKFTATLNGKKLYTTVNGQKTDKFTTDANGKLNIELTINSAGTDTLVLTETSVDAKYQKLDNPITIKINKAVDSNTREFKVTSVTGENLSDGVSVQLDQATLKINVNAEDPAVIKEGSYNLNVNKIDSKNGTKLAGAQFSVKVNGTDKGTYTTNAEGKFATPIQVAIKEVGTDLIEIEEIQAPDKYQKLGGTLQIQVTKVTDKDSWSYIAKEVKVISGFKNAEGQDSYSEASLSQNKDIVVQINNDRANIELGGNVWEDIRHGKDSLLNGIKDDDEEFIQGMLVTLHTEDGENIEYSDSTSISTRTDENGYYQFKVPEGQKYYIEYVYNGQNYQHAKYTPWEDSSTPMTSNATESEGERDALNKALETITTNMKVGETEIKNDINTKGPTYIEDKCYTISSYTGGHGNESDIQYFEKTTKNINFGITKREEVKIALMKDVYEAELSIKGYTQTYKYNKREAQNQDREIWTVTAKIADGYYNQAYTREVKESDYQYTDDKLKANVTYKIELLNLSDNIDCEVKEVVDYFDKELKYKEAYIKDGDNKINLVASENSKNNHTETVANFNKLYFDLSGNKIPSYDSIIIYVVFEVDVDENGKMILDQGSDDLGKSNVAEITGYATYYSEKATSPNKDNKDSYTEYEGGDPAGRVDVDSNPGNADPNDKNTYESDADEAPPIKFQLEGLRTISGEVWEDKRTVMDDTAKTAVGDGIKDDNEDRIKDIKVQLIDATTNNVAKMFDVNTKTWVDAETITDENGKYQITSFVPGEYYVKFIYPNGQDYKSTTYNYEKVNSGFDVNNPDREIGTLIEPTDVNYSDARDIWGDEITPGTRSYVNGQYSGKTDVARANELAERLKNGDFAIGAITGKKVLQIERDPSDGNSDSGRRFEVENVDLGLQERPKQQIAMRKEVSNVKVTLSSGKELFNTSGKATNVIWIDKQGHTTGYDNNLMKTPEVRNPTQNQAVILTMDEGLMHGATIQIDYKMTAENIGEADYASKKFYYTGKRDGQEEVVTTKVFDVIDYVGASLGSGNASTNNLQYTDSKNTGWVTVNKNEIITNKVVQYKDANGNDVTSENIKTYKTILKHSFGGDDGKILIPKLCNEEQSQVTTTLTLSSIMSGVDANNNLSYNNMAELINFENKIGRKIEYSTVGNQNPNEPTKEVDTDTADVTILTPFGQTRIYYIIGTICGLILIAGLAIVIKITKNK